jgi:hypothetical protein
MVKKLFNASMFVHVRSGVLACLIGLLCPQNVLSQGITNLIITGNDIPESGLASAYISHSFRIDGEGLGNITDGKWAFVLPSSNGEETVVKSAEDGLTFDIDSLSNPDDFTISKDGIICGKIRFSGILDGQAVDLQYDVTIDLKPLISNVTCETQKIDGLDSYNAFCKVDYKGADYVYVKLEEEYGAIVRTQFVREPYSAHFACRNIASPFYAWIDIEVENQYGRTVYTIELPPFDDQQTAIDNPVGDDNVYSEIKVYTADGKFLKSISDVSATQSLLPGMYVLAYCKGNKVVRTSKILR